MSKLEIRQSLLLSKECERVLAHHAKTFYFASLFLPKKNKNYAAIIYAFCRLVDDIVDCNGEDFAREEIRNLLLELDGKRTARPLIHLYSEVGKEINIDPQITRELVLGVAQDLDHKIIQDDAQLMRYCYGVAGTVGVLMCAALGIRDPKAYPYAIDLGIAMQLTNICRDVLEDAKMNRVYLPKERLVENKITPQSLIKSKNQNVSKVVQELLGLADTYYQSGLDGLRYIPWRPRFAILVAAHLYRLIGFRLRLQNYNPLLGRVYVPIHKKILGAIYAFFKFFTPNILGLSHLKQHNLLLHKYLKGLPGADQ